MAVAAVTGDDEDEPMSAADRGQMVAMAIGEALGAMSADDGEGTRVMHGTTAPVATVMNAVRMNDHTGKTWAEIVGETSKKRIGTSGTDTNEVDAASIAGMTLEASTQMATADGEFEDNGLQVGATYKGILGTAFCQGSDCKVEEGEGDDRKFTGSWYFHPGFPEGVLRESPGGHHIHA